MHDDLMERRLRGALHDEAARLPFTITAAELERRAALRGRSPGSRRLTLLLAAAVAIGAIGVSALAGALSNQTPRPTAPVTAVQPTASSIVTPPEPTRTPPGDVMPSLDELIGEDDSTVLLAQAHGPGNGAGEAGFLTPNPRVLMSLGEISGDGTYAVAVACFGRGLWVDVREPGANPDSGEPLQSFPCGGQPSERTFEVAGPARVWIRYDDPTSWRLVVRSQPSSLPLPTADPILPPRVEGITELARADDQRIGPDGQPFAGGRMVLQEIQAVPARLDYGLRMWCEPGHSMRLLIGDTVDNDAEITPFTETHIRCDGRVHEIELLTPEKNGARVFVASQPDARWSVVIESETPPVDYATVSGWRQEGGIGPELSFETHESSFSSAVEGGGPVMVVLSCVGPEQDVHVTFEVLITKGQVTETKGSEFDARCTTEGASTGQTFETGDGGFIAGYTAPAGTWTTLTILSPDPAATPE